MFITFELKGRHDSWFLSRSKYLQGRVHNTPYAMCASFHVCTWIMTCLIVSSYVSIYHIFICSCLSVWTLSCLIAVCKYSMLYMCKWLAVLVCLHIRLNYTSSLIWSWSPAMVPGIGCICLEVLRRTPECVQGTRVHSKIGPCHGTNQRNEFVAHHGIQ